MLNKILIVDDSEPIHQIYRITLRRYQCETIAALSREEGLKKLIENPGVKLILVDMNMPLSRVSGLEFIQEVKDEEAYAKIPIVVVTTRGKSYIKEAHVLAQGNLMKPFISHEIHAAVEKYFPGAVSA